MSKKKGKPGAARISPDMRNMVMLTSNPIWRVFAKKDPVSPADQTSIGLSARQALYALTNADGRFEHFKELLVTAYAGTYLAEQGYGADVLGDFHGALEVLLGCHARAKSGLGYALCDDEAHRVDALLGLHEQQVQIADKAQLAATILESYRRMALAL
jgi:hypothetical protein